MKNNWLKITAAVAAVVCFAGIAQALPITGNIAFSGGVVLNSDDVSTATAATGWVTPTVLSGSSGSFSSIAGGTSVTLLPFTLNSGPLANFWTVGGFTFSLLSSVATFVNFGPGHLLVNLSGTVSGNGLDTTPFSGTFDIANPDSGTVDQFSVRLSFNSVPDGGTTVMLLGGALMGLGLLKRKLS